MDHAWILRLFELNRMTVERNLDGLTEEDALRVPSAGGNCLNWVLGHVLATRREMFALAGLAPFWTDAGAAPYCRGARPLRREDAAPLAELLALLHASQETLRVPLESGEADLEAPLPEPGPRLGACLGQALYAFAWHEGYHAGQIGLLRRLAGHPGALG